MGVWVGEVGVRRGVLVRRCWGRSNGVGVVYINDGLCGLVWFGLVMCFSLIDGWMDIHDRFPLFLFLFLLSSDIYCVVGYGCGYSYGYDYEYGYGMI